MLRLLKIFIGVLLILSLAVLVLFFYFSSPNLEEQDHHIVIDYPYENDAMDSTLSVLTYNIGYLSGMTNNLSVRRERDFFDENLRHAKNLVTSLSAAVMGLQEIDVDARRSFYANQVDTLAHTGKYRAAYQSINWDKKYVPFPYWPPANHFGKMLSGQAILAKAPIASADTHILPTNLRSPAYYRAFYLDRLLQVVEIVWKGERVKIMNVHLEAYDLETRLAQTEIVKEIYETYASQQPVILMGDFNSQVPAQSAEKDAIEILEEAEWLASAIPFGRESTSGTFSSEQPERMIDYILYNENYLKCRQSRVVSEAGQISDHLPVWAEFELLR